MKSIWGKKNIFLLSLMIAMVTWRGLAVAESNTNSSVDEELQFKAGDEKGNEIKALKAELLIHKNDQKAMAQLEKLMKKYRGSAMEASLNFRMAELYMRKSKTATFFEVHRGDDNVVQFSPKELKNQTSRSWIQRAVGIYDSIEKRFTHYRDMDLVLFNGSFAKQLIGDEKGAIRGYSRVINDFSDSYLVPDCHLAIGETYFSQKQFQKALDEFEKIRKYPDSRVYPYGLYKSAWALYNLRQAERGLGVLEEVVAYSKQGGESDERRLNLTREALDDMVLFYEDTRRPADAVSYFRKQGGDERVADLVIKLGKLYQRHSRYQNVETVFIDLLSRLPLVAERPLIQKDLIESYEITKRRDLAAKQLESFAAVCADESDWFKVQGVDARNSCYKALEESGKGLIAKWSKENKRSPNVEIAHLLVRAYVSVLKHGSRISDEDRIRFNFAELLFGDKDYRRSSEQFSLAAAKTKDPKIRHDGAYGAIVALEKATADKWSDQDERLFSVLAQNYLTLNHNGQFVTDISFKKAFIAYEKGRYDEASPQLQSLAFKHSKSERGLKAATLFLDILNLKKDFVSLKEQSLALYELVSDAKFKDEFMKIHRQATFVTLQDLESKQKWSLALAGYEKFYRTHENSDLADKALYNAIQSGRSARNFEKVSELSEIFVAKYPQNDKRNDVLKALAALYEAQLKLTKASQCLMKLSQIEPQKKDAYMLSATDLLALDQKWKEALPIYQTLSTKTGSTEGRMALERLVLYHEHSKEEKKTSAFYEELIERNVQPQASIASYRLAQKAFENEDFDLAFKLAKRTVGMKKEKDASIAAVSNARLIQAKILEKEFEQASVKARPERLSLVLQIKTSKLEQAQKAYQDVISYGEKRSAIEALMRMGGCYGKFAQSLHTIEAPKDTPVADQKKFKQEIENMAMPMEEKHAEMLHLALKQAKSLERYDGLAGMIQKELDRLVRRQVSQVLQAQIVTPLDVVPMVN